MRGRKEEEKQEMERNYHQALEKGIILSSWANMVSGFSYLISLYIMYYFLTIYI